MAQVQVRYYGPNSWKLLAVTHVAYHRLNYEVSFNTEERQPKEKRQY